MEINLNFHQLILVQHHVIKTLEEAVKLAAYLSRFYSGNQKNIELGLNEIFINAIEHGNLQIGYHEKQFLKKENKWHETINEKLSTEEHKSKSVYIHFELTPSYIVVIVKDEGSGFNWEEHIPPFFPEESQSGRGLLMAKNLCFDRLEFSKKGNEVWCIVYR